MADQRPTEAEAFFLFLADEIKRGGGATPPEELLQTWRATQAEAIEDICQSMQDLEFGRVRSFGDADVEIRRKLGFQPKEHAEPWLAIAGMWRDHPDLDDVVENMKVNRRESDADPNRL